MKIDVHCHGYPAELFEFLAAHYPERIVYRDGKGGPAAGPWIDAWDENVRLREMDDCGIDLEILSSPQAYAGGGEHLPHLCRMVNDVYSAAVGRHPDRFRSFVHLPFLDVDAAMAELRRVADDSAFVGVFLPSNVAGTYPDDQTFEPLWHEFTARHLPVFLHPLQSSCYKDPLNPATLTLPFDTTLAVVRMAVAGVFDRHPELALLVSHLGGTLPFLARRIDLGYDLPSYYSTPIWTTDQRPSDHIGRLYVDTAQGWSEPAFRCAESVVSIDHILFGTDHFDAATRFVEKTVAFLEDLDLEDDARESVFSGNAMTLFRLSASDVRTQTPTTLER
ncbi:MAG TPA: amidohydrolase family protein [Ilumatobacteraceae bacterium]